MSNNKPIIDFTPSVKVELNDMTLVFTPAAAQKVAAALIAAGYAALHKERFVKYVIRHRFDGELIYPSEFIYYNTYEEAIKAFEQDCLSEQEMRTGVTPLVFGITALDKMEEIKATYVNIIGYDGNVITSIPCLDLPAANMEVDRIKNQIDYLRLEVKTLAGNLIYTLQKKFHRVYDKSQTTFLIAEEDDEK